MQYRIVYVGASLTTASNKLRSAVPAFKQLLRERTDSIVLRWVGMDTEIDEGFYSRDLGNVRMCDVMIAIVDEPSIGLGMELSQAIHDKKPVLCLYHKSTKVSRMIEAAAKDGHLHMASYADIYDAADIAAAFIQESVSTIEG